MNYVKYITIAILSLFLFACGGEQHVPKKPQLKVEKAVPTAIEWLEFNPIILEMAAEQNKAVMIYLYSTACLWCTKMDKTLEHAAIVQIAHEQLLCTKVNVDEWPQTMDLITQEEKMVPAFLFLGPPNEHRIGVKAELAGYFRPEVFLDVLQTVAERFNGQSTSTREPQIVFTR